MFHFIFRHYFSSHGKKTYFIVFWVFFSWKNQDILYWIWMNFERILSAFLNNESFFDRGMTKEMPNFSLNITTGSWEWEMRLSNYRRNYGIQSIYLLILLLSNQKFFDLEQLFRLRMETRRATKKGRESGLPNQLYPLLS